MPQIRAIADMPEKARLTADLPAMRAAGQNRLQGTNVRYAGARNLTGIIWNSDFVQNVTGIMNIVRITYLHINMLIKQKDKWSNDRWIYTR